MHKTNNRQSPKFSSDVNSKRRPTFNEFPCRKISITGGTGSVGKTSIALKMAMELASMGHKTLLIDCNLNSNHICKKLGAEFNFEFHKLLTGEISFHDFIFKKGNLHLLGTETNFLDEQKNKFEQIIIDIINSHEKEYDYILVDCPSYEKDYFLDLNGVCDHRLIVITPDRKSITDSYSFVKALFHKLGIKENHLFVNKYQTEKQFLKVATSLTETIENFIGANIHLLGGMPKYNFDDNGFDTFFLSESKNEINHNFVKLLLGFTEKAVGSLNAQNTSLSYQTNEQDVH